MNPSSPSSVEEILTILDRASESYLRTDEKFGKWHKFAVVDREKAARLIQELFVKERIEELSALLHFKKDEVVSEQTVARKVSERIAELRTTLKEKQ